MTFIVKTDRDSFIFKCTNYHQNISLADIIFENGDDIWHFYQKEGLSDNPDIIDKYRNDLKISFTQSGTPSDLTSEQKINLFRIAQEALQNSIKHAKAKNITLSISFTERNINLTVTDDGIGFNKKNISKNDFKEKRRPRGLGRRSMEYRANQLNGTFKIESGKNSGTKVIVTIPKITSAEKEMS